MTMERKRHRLPPPPDSPEANPWTETVTGKERLKAMLTSRFWLDYQPFLSNVVHLTGISILGGVLVGGCVGMVRTNRRFKKDHRLVPYKHPVEYKRQQQVHSLMGGSIAASQAGLDMGLTMAFLCLAHSAMYLYENQVTFTNIYVGWIAVQMRFGIGRGWRRLGASALLGSLKGLPIAGVCYLVAMQGGEEQRRRLARDEARYQRYLEEVLKWREEGRLMGRSSVRHFDSYVVKPRYWHTPAQDAWTLQFRQLPELTPEKEQRLFQDMQALRSKSLGKKRESEKDSTRSAELNS